MTWPCERCGSEVQTRLSGLCLWCWATERDRPDDAAEKYGEVVEA